MNNGEGRQPSEGTEGLGETHGTGVSGNSDEATTSLPQVSSHGDTSAHPVVPAPWTQASAGDPHAAQGAQYGQATQFNQQGTQYNQGAQFNEGTQYGQGTQYSQGTQYGQDAAYGQSAPYGQALPSAEGATPFSQGSAPMSATAPTYPHGAGYAAETTQSYAPAGASPGYAAGAAPGQSSVLTDEKPKRSYGVPVVVGAAVIGSLLGGLIGGGVGSAANGAKSQSSSNQVISTGQNASAASAVASKASPSVVTIGAIKDQDGGSGSGIVLDKEGHILTNAHVVTVDGKTDGVDLQVRLFDNKVYKATLVGADPLADLAVIKVDAPNLQPATLGDSSKVNVGDMAVVLGAPLGLAGTVTDGIISTKSRTITLKNSAVPDDSSSSAADKVYVNVIQTDAALNPGNSGGALVNGEGQVIGVNVAMASQSNSSGDSVGASGLGFAIPINSAKRVADSLMKDGKASHGFLGVQVRAQKPEGISGDSIFSTGAVVSDVVSGSPADKAGLKKNDVITAIGELRVEDPKSLTGAVRTYPAGQEATFKVMRDGKEKEIKVTLGEVPQKDS